MVVLDAQALEAFLMAEPGMLAVASLLTSGEQVTIAAVNLGETADRMLRVRGVESELFGAVVAELDIHVMSVDADLALSAAALRSSHYHRARRPVSLPDCVAAALSLDRAARLATSDPHLLDLVREEGGLVEPLAGSDGTTWTP